MTTTPTTPASTGEAKAASPREELVSLRDCPPGPFLFEGRLGFKTEYMAMEADGPVNIPGDQVRWKMGHSPDVYVMASGECFWGGARAREERDALMVTPVEVEPVKAASPEGEAVGSAEQEVGRYVYMRIEALMSADAASPAGRELNYLAQLVSDVEEYGADLMEPGDLQPMPQFSPPAPSEAPAIGEGLAIYPAMNDPYWMELAREIHRQANGPSAWSTLKEPGRQYYADRLYRAHTDAAQRLRYAAPTPDSQGEVS